MDIPLGIPASRSGLSWHKPMLTLYPQPQKTHIPPSASSWAHASMSLGSLQMLKLTALASSSPAPCLPSFLHFPQPWMNCFEFLCIHTGGRGDVHGPQVSSQRWDQPYHSALHPVHPLRTTAWAGKLPPSPPAARYHRSHGLFYPNQHDMVKSFACPHAPCQRGAGEAGGHQQANPHTTQ